MKKILPLYLAAVMAFGPSARALADSEKPTIDISGISQERVEQTTQRVEGSIDSVRDFLGIPDTLYGDVGEGVVEPIDSLALKALEMYGDQARSLNRRISYSTNNLNDILEDDAYTASEDSLAYKNNFFIINEKTSEIEGMKDMLKTVKETVKEQFGENSTQYKTLEAQLTAATDYIRNEINPIGGQLMRLHNDYYSAAAKNTEKTAWYNTIGWDKDFSKKGIAKKAGWTVGTILLGYGLSKIGDGNGQPATTGGYSQSGGDAFSSH